MLGEQGRRRKWFGLHSSTEANKKQNSFCQKSNTAPGYRKLKHGATGVPSFGVHFQVPSLRPVSSGFRTQVG